MGFLMPSPPKPPKAPKPIPVPTIDYAAMQAEKDANLHRRRGRKGNVFAGARPQAPVLTGTHTLLG